MFCLTSDHGLGSGHLFIITSIVKPKPHCFDSLRNYQTTTQTKLYNCTKSFGMPRCCSTLYNNKKFGLRSGYKMMANTSRGIFWEA